MHVSVRTLHGIRTVVEMAKEPENQPLHASELAEQRYVNENYLIQILSKLREADIVSTKKGPHGGYRLARSAGDITLGEIVRTLEGPTVIAPCTQPEHSDCEIIDQCSTQTILAALAGKIDALLETITVEDIKSESPSGSPETLRTGSH